MAICITFVPVPPSLPPASPSLAPQFTPEHLQQVLSARHAMKKLRRCVLTAKIDGWSVGSFGLLTAGFGLTDLPSLGLGVVMIGVATVELRAANRLKQLDLTVVKTLGWNQIVFGSALMIYAIIRIASVSTGESPYAAMISQEPQLKDMLGPLEGLTRQILIAVYACLIAVAIFGQGGLAMYYFTRGKSLRVAIDATPAWILDMQRAGVSI